MSDKIGKWRIAVMALPAVMASMLVFAFGTGTSVSAQTTGTEPTKSAESATPTDADSDEEVTVDVGGTQVAVDSQTGRLRQPTREEAKVLFEAMQKLLNASTDGLTITKHADGSESIDLEGRFQNFSVGKLNPDGTVSTKCVSNVGEAAAFLGVDPKSGVAPAKTTSGGTVALKAAPAKKTARASVLKKSRKAHR